MARIFVFLLALLCCSTAHAQRIVVGHARVSASSYTGPGDIVSSAGGFFGAISYNAAYATGSNNGLNVRCSSGSNINATNNILIKSNGDLDQTTMSSNCGTDGTSTSSATGTALLTVASISGSCKPNDQITDTTTPANISAGTYIVSNGTGSGGVGTYNTNIVLGTFAADTVVCAAGLATTEAYDGSGTGNNVTQATGATQPIVLTNCLNGHACLAGTAQYLTATIASTPNASIAGVVERTAAFTTEGAIIGKTSSAALNFANVANEIQLNVSQTITANDLVWHTVQSVYGSTSLLYADGSGNTAAVAAPAAGTGLGIRAFASGSTPMNGKTAWVGFWPTTSFTTGQIGNMCHNDNTLFALSLAC